MTHQEATTLAPGWYADPWDEGVLVWWDGEGWGPRAPMTSVDPVLPRAPLSAPHDDVPRRTPDLAPRMLPTRALRCRACGQASRSWESSCMVCGVPLPHGGAHDRPERASMLDRAWWTAPKVFGLLLAVVLGAAAVVAATSPGDYNAGYVWGTDVITHLDASQNYIGDGDGDLDEEIGSTCSSAAYGNPALGSVPVQAADPAVWYAGCVAGMTAASGDLD